MDPRDNTKKAKFIFSLAVAYSIIVPVLGKQFSSNVFSFLVPLFHTLIGIFFFNPLSVFLSLNRYALSFSMLFLAIAVCYSLISNDKYASSLKRFFSISVKTYSILLLILFTMELFFTSVLISPFFLYCSFAVIYINIRASAQSIDFIEENRRSPMRLFFFSFLFSAFAAAFLGVFGKQWLFLFMALLVIGIWNSISLINSQKRGSWGIATSPAGMAVIIFFCSLGGIGNFYAQKPDCGKNKFSACGAKLFFKSKLRPYDILVPPNDNRLYAVYKEGAAAEIDLQSGTLLSTARPDRRGSMQRLIFNDSTNQIYSTFWRAEKNGAVVVMNRDPFRINRIIDIPSCPAIWLELDNTARSLIVVCEGGDKIVWIDYLNWKTIATLRLPRTTWPHAAVIDSARRKVFVCAGSMSRYLYEINADKHSITRRVPVGYVTLGMAYDQPTGRLFLSKPLSSKILILNTFSMKIAGHIKTMPGVRDISVDERRRTLFAGNYIPGTVQSFNIDGNIRALSASYVAKQVRGIFHDVHTNRTYAATSCGIIEVQK